MPAVRLVPLALAVAAVVSSAAPAGAGGWDTLRYVGTVTVDGTGAPQIQADAPLTSYGAGDGSSATLSDRVDLRRNDSFIFSPSPSRAFGLTYGSSTHTCRNTVGGSPQANTVNLYGPDFKDGGRTTGTVRCVIAGTPHEFRYDDGVAVSRTGDVWRFSSSGSATVSRQGASGKWSVVERTPAVQFDVSFTATSSTPVG